MFCRGDIILVVSDGLVAEYGTHTELMEREADVYGIFLSP